MKPPNYDKLTAETLRELIDNGEDVSGRTPEQLHAIVRTAVELYRANEGKSDG